MEKDLFLHIGARKTLHASEIIGIFDMDNATISVVTRRFLSFADKKGEILAANEELPKAFLLTGERIRCGAYRKRTGSAIPGGAARGVIPCGATQDGGAAPDGEAPGVTLGDATGAAMNGGAAVVLPGGAFEKETGGAALVVEFPSGSVGGAAESKESGAAGITPGCTAQTMRDGGTVGAGMRSAGITENGNDPVGQAQSVPERPRQQIWFSQLASGVLHNRIGALEEYDVRRLPRREGWESAKDEEKALFAPGGWRNLSSDPLAEDSN